MMEQIPSTTTICRVCNILYIPDEILIEIILYLNARERIPLGNSCKRFEDLVFTNQKLLRDLDFSKGGHLTSASDIRRYFCDEDMAAYILRVNLENVDCIDLNDVLLNYIDKAINLVDINISGIFIRNRWVLGDILRPFEHLKRLTISWPRRGSFNDDDPYCTVLQAQLSKLTYLSVKLEDIFYSAEFYQALQLCQELEELRFEVVQPEGSIHQTFLGLKLKNLQIVEYYGPCIREVAEYFVSTFSNPKEWTYFQLFNPLTFMDGFYLERNLEVCEELLESKSIKEDLYNYPKFAFKLGGFVVSVCLLKEVMRISTENWLDKFCCFSLTDSNDDKDYRLFLPTVYGGSKMWTLKINEAKRLLKNPRYQISYLNIFHNIDENCDVDVVASVFPSLTELVLSNVTKSKQKAVQFQKSKLNKSPASTMRHQLDERPNLDSSFKKLVETTPQMKHLIVIADTRQLEDDEIWDLAALHLISDWKNLTTLRLWHIPITDGLFLIEIGKQCTHLEYLELYNLGSAYGVSCYKTDLLRMLNFCTTLRDFTLQQDNIGHLSELFVLLSKNCQLKSVCVKSNGKTESTIGLKPSIEQLLHYCPQLDVFTCVIHEMSQTESQELMSTLQRLKSKLNRPTIKFQVAHCMDPGNIIDAPLRPRVLVY